MGEGEGSRERGRGMGQWLLLTVSFRSCAE